MNIKTWYKDGKERKKERKIETERETGE